MATAKVMRKKYHDTYKTLLGRNHYSQTLRKYVYEKNKDGKYYSDCSSSQCATLMKIGIKLPYLLNTAGMYNSDKFEEVDVEIKNGHIVDVTKLRVADQLMFRGNDPKRPLQIGHVEGVYEINGDTEDKIIIAGHGSEYPTKKNLKTYCSNMSAQKAPNGKNHGLVCVLRCIPDDKSEQPKQPKSYKAKISNCYYLNVRSKAGSDSTCKILRVLKAGDIVEIESTTTNSKTGTIWGKLKGEKAYISMKYATKI